jgi:RNA polymerase sigma factor (TIGR02999 family)
MPGSKSAPPNGPSASGPDPGSPRPEPDVTRLLLEWRDGSGEALDELMPLVYGELRRLASRALRGEAQGHTLRTTALVHEAYVRLVGANVDWEGSRHFMRVAARAMRRVLVDNARKRRSHKRGSGSVPVGLDTLEGVLPADSRPDDVLALDEALERLMTLDERKGRTVELHYFGGLSYVEVAEALEVSPATVHRDLRMARAWLFKEVQGDGGTR